jgi:hypothetical protein
MIILPAIVESIVSRKDRTWKVSFGTQEMSPDKAAALLTMNQQLCYLAIKPEHFHEEEQQLLEELKADQELIGKTPGQRLRAVLYRNWEQNDESFPSFTMYYEHWMEHFIAHMKSKLL